jgi:hypothetical protein
MLLVAKHQPCSNSFPSTCWEPEQWVGDEQEHSHHPQVQPQHSACSTGSRSLVVRTQQNTPTAPRNVTAATRDCRCWRERCRTTSEPPSPASAPSARASYRPLSRCLTVCGVRCTVHAVSPHLLKHLCQCSVLACADTSSTDTCRVVLWHANERDGDMQAPPWPSRCRGIRRQPAWTSIKRASSRTYRLPTAHCQHRAPRAASAGH